MKQLLTAALGAAIAMQALAATRSHAHPHPADLARHIQCEGGRDAARLDALNALPDGTMKFRISTATDIFDGVANPRNPKFSMEKQVLALNGKKYFCLHD